MPFYLLLHIHFLMEKDFYGQGETVYPIERINFAKYRSDFAIGKLMILTLEKIAEYAGLPLDEVN